MAKFDRTVLVTGGTGGLGYEAAFNIARRRPNWLVVIASRTNNGAAEKLNQQLQQDNVRFEAIDLSSIEFVRDFVKSWEQKDYPPIQALLLNAISTTLNNLEFSSDGYERTFAIGHVGHSLLLALLGPHMDKSARIVITGSGVHDPAQKWKMPKAHYESAEILAHPPQPHKSSPSRGLAAYTALKLAHVLWMYALDRRLHTARQKHDRHWTVTQLDPGAMPATGFSQNGGPIARWIFNNIFANMIPLMRLLVHPKIFTPQECGKALADLALNKDLEGVSGKYFEPSGEAVQTSLVSRDEAKQEDVWRWTVETLARDERERELFECTFS